MSEKPKMNGAGGVSWPTILEYAKEYVPKAVGTIITLVAFAVGGTWGVFTMVHEFRSAHKQTEETLADHETRIETNTACIAELKPKPEG